MSPLRAIVEAVLPTTCAACGRVLMRGEEQLCVHCAADLAPEPGLLLPDSDIERRLLGIPSLQAAAACCYYGQHTTARRVVHAMKFHGNAELCLQMGRLLAARLAVSGRFDDVDCLVPVPLHPLRRFARGYNQSLLICRGIAQRWPRPIEMGLLLRHRYTRKQSRSRLSERASNVEGAFRLRHPEALAGRHVLLVDDVLTTGSTILACADALAAVPDIRISVAVLCLSQG